MSSTRLLGVLLFLAAGFLFFGSASEAECIPTSCEEQCACDWRACWDACSGFSCRAQCNNEYEWCSFCNCGPWNPGCQYVWNSIFLAAPVTLAYQQHGSCPAGTFELFATDSRGEV
jgi:hypothetical protein